MTTKLHSHQYSRADLALVIVDEMYQMVGILDANGINLESNQTSLDAAGFKREEVVGKYFWETPWWPDETRSKIRSAVLKAAKGEFIRFEIENKTKDGSIYVDFSLRPVFDSSGKVQFIIPEGRDITARKSAEEEIRRKNIELEAAYELLHKQKEDLRVAHGMVENALIISEERLHLATETAQLGFWDLNLKTGHLFMDTKVQAMLGRSPKDLNGTIEDFYSSLHPEDLVRVRKQFESAIEQHTHYNTEYRTLSPDGSTHFVVAKGRALYDEAGNPIRVIGVAIEVTEYKLARIALENRFSELAESMPQIVFTTTPDGHPIYFNQKWYEYSGEVLAWTEVIHPEELPKFLDKWKVSQPWTIEFRLKHRNGSYRWFLGRAVPSYDDKGKTKCWYGAMSDIDDQKQVQADLSKAVRVRDEFLSVASHELKTPLTSLKLQSQMLQRIVTDNKQLNAIKSSEGQIDRITRLIDDMLDISRITTGKLSIHIEEFNLCEVIEETYSRLKPQFDALKCLISLQCEQNVIGRWDRFRIEQVVLNLISNALKYGNREPVEVKVNSTDKEAIISVIDHGIGISLEDHKRIFELFERAVERSEISGLGLGLYISRQIVEMHGGNLSVESDHGRGSKFLVKLPLNLEGSLT